MTRRPAEISASILNADFADLGADVVRATAAGVDSIHLDVMDGHFVDNISFGPGVVAAVRPRSPLPFHAHLMIAEPLRYLERFAAAGSDLIVFHLEAADDPAAVIAAIRALDRQVGLAINPETAAGAAEPWLAELDLMVVMTVHPGFGGQAFLADQLPKVRALADMAAARGIDLPIAVDGGVNVDTVGAAHAAGSSVLVVGSGLYRHPGDLAPVVLDLRRAAEGGA